MNETIYDRHAPKTPLDLAGEIFQPIMMLPDRLPVFDFTESYDPQRMLDFPYGVGRYDEVRPSMYTESYFASETRNIHMGIDLAAPPGTEVYAFASGIVHSLGDNDRPQDYGPTVVTVHEIKNQIIYALYGHLSRSTLHQLSVGDDFSAGAHIGWIGEKHENGGWNPHLHFQLSRVEPIGCDLPGAVSAAQREWALQAFPDPRLVLGPLYE